MPTLGFGVVPTDMCTYALGSTRSRDAMVGVGGVVRCAIDLNAGRLREGESL